MKHFAEPFTGKISGLTLCGKEIKFLPQEEVLGITVGYMKYIKNRECGSCEECRRIARLSKTTKYIRDQRAKYNTQEGD